MNTKTIYSVIGYDTNYNGQWMIGSFMTEEDAITVYHEIIAKDLILLGMIDETILDDYDIKHNDYELDVDDIENIPKIVNILDLGLLDGLDYGYNKTIIQGYDRTIIYSICTSFIS